MNFASPAVACIFTRKKSEQLGSVFVLLVSTRDFAVDSFFEYCFKLIGACSAVRDIAEGMVARKSAVIGKEINSFFQNLRQLLVAVDFLTGDFFERFKPRKK